MNLHRRRRQKAPAARHGEPRVSRRVPLKGTEKTATVYLCHGASLAVGYAQTWAELSGLPGVTTSAVHRRALALYMDHLSRPCIDASLELAAIQAASAAPSVVPEAQQAAFDRLDAPSTIEELPPFVDIARGPGWREASVRRRIESQKELQALDDRVDALLGASLSGRYGNLFNTRRKGGKTQ